MTEPEAQNHELNPVDVFGETLVEYFTGQTGTCVKELGWSLNVTITFDESDQEN